MLSPNYEGVVGNDRRRRDVRRGAWIGDRAREIAGARIVAIGGDKSSRNANEPVQKP